MTANPFVTAPSLENVRDGRSVLQIGQKGEAVARTQLLLGVFDDGNFGAHTKRAVVAFQHDRGIEVSADDEGKIGSETLAALEQANVAFLASIAKIDKRNKTVHLHPRLRESLAGLAEALEGRHLQALITDGFRTFAEQDALFAKGRTKLGSIVTNAKGGLSNHNYGLAVDFFPVIDGRVLVEIPQAASQAQRFKDTQQAIIEESERLRLSSGAHFTRVDRPHVQLLAEDVLKPRKCLEIFRANGDDFDAVWDEASRLL